MIRANRAGPLSTPFFIQLGVLLSIALLVCAFSAAAAGAGLAPLGSQQPASSPFVPGEVLIGWQPISGFIPRGARPAGPRADQASPEWQDAAQILEANTGLEVLDVQPYFGTARLAVPPGQEQAEIERLSALPWISYAEPNYIVYAADFYPNDPYISLQWNLQRIYAPAAWDATMGDDSIIVAVVDSGIDLGHPEFSGRLLQGFDYVENDGLPDDDNGHGTHVAGILAATAGNATGIAGLAPNTKILPLKVLDANGFGTVSRVAQALDFARFSNARIVNLSLQDTANSNTVHDAIDRAIQGGILVVAAAGNCAQGGPYCNYTINPTIYPAAYPGVVAVAASDYYDNWASYSGYKPYVALAAPGGTSSYAILSTLPLTQDGYGYEYGTSMATPLASAAAALVWTVDPGATSTQVADILKQTADKVGAAYIDGRNDYFGYGRLNVARAVHSLYPPALSPSPESLAFLLGAPVTERRSYVTLKNPSDQVISWQATVPPGADWLSISPLSGTANFSQPGILTVQAGPTALVPGSYTGRIHITYNTPQLTSFDIPVQLWVAARLYQTYLPQAANQYFGASRSGPLPGSPSR